MDRHHINQDAAYRNIPGYSKSKAPTIELKGPSNQPGTEHYKATQSQRNSTFGGTHGAERQKGYNALRDAGLSAEHASDAVGEVDKYFDSIGVTRETKTRIPGSGE